MKKYNKDLNYSYTLGIYPTIELITYKPEMIIKIVVSNKIHKEAEEKLIKLCKDNNIMFEYDDVLISKICNKENCFVIGIFKKYDSNLDTDRSHVVLVNPSNMGNLGTIIRTMLGFDCNNLGIILPGADRFDPQTIRSSMGSIFNVNIELFDSFEQYVSKYSRHKVYTFMLNGKSNVKDINKGNLNSLVFGNESSGLDDSYLKYESVYIEHSSLIDSLNITLAVGIGLFNFYK